MWEETAKRYCT